MEGRQKIGNRKQAVQETESEGEKLYRRGGAGEQRLEKEDLYFLQCNKVEFRDVNAEVAAILT